MGAHDSTSSAPGWAQPGSQNLGRARLGVSTCRRSSQARQPYPDPAFWGTVGGVLFGRASWRERPRAAFCAAERQEDARYVRRFVMASAATPRNAPIPAPIAMPGPPPTRTPTVAPSPEPTEMNTASRFELLCVSVTRHLGHHSMLALGSPCTREPWHTTKRRHHLGATASG